MDTITLVKDQIDDGQRLLDRLDDQGIVATAACLAKPVDSEKWSLYIAAPIFDEKGPSDAYGKVVSVLRSLPESLLTVSDVRLIGEKHPIAQYVLDVLRRHPHRPPIRLQPSSLAGIDFEDIYVYPLGKRVEVTIYHVFYPGAPDEPGILSLDSSLLARHFSSYGVDGTVYEGQTGIDCVVAAPKGASLERDNHGRMVLAWEMYDNRTQSDANEVWSLANLRLHGFRFLREPA